MLDIKFIRENPDLVKKDIKNKGFQVNIEQLLELDRKRRNLIKKIDELRAERNEISEGIKDNPQLMKKAKELKEKIIEREKSLRKIKSKFEELLLSLPNLPLEDVPVGKDERDNVLIREWGKKPKFDFQPKDYLEIAQKLDIIDVKRAAKVSGTRFGYLKKEAVLLAFALIDFALQFLIKKGFVPLLPPVMIRPEMMMAMGYLEKSKVESQKSKVGEELYFLRDDDLVLVGTAEQSIGPMHANEIFEERELPKRYLAFSSCFRREAGAYGKDTKGIFRVHQFEKLEMFSFTKPEDSKKEHHFFLSLQEKLMQKLKIPYRVVQMCTGDLGMPTAAKYDIEAWFPSENRYRETHSCSNCTDFQARRLNIRYRNKEGKLNFLHTINGTAFALGRTIIAIIENYQTKKETIIVPEVLRQKVGKKEIGTF